jgi:hypothetical protein
MDATQQFLQQERIVVPQQFVVAGISKVSFFANVSHSCEFIIIF